MLQTAAILHDIGYSPDIVRSGFHALDGAVFLRARGVDAEIVSLVAHQLLCSSRSGVSAV